MSWPRPSHSSINSQSPPSHFSTSPPPPPPPPAAFLRRFNSPLKKPSKQVSQTAKNMRASAALFHSSPVTKTATSETTPAAAEETFSPPATLQQSPWHSPVPYLFGGLAAMLGLIAFALLILACSYWKLDEGGGERNVEEGKGDGGLDMKAAPPFEEKFLVIMAGDVRPTFLATPTSFNDGHVKDKENENYDERIPVNGQEIQLNREHVQT